MAPEEPESGHERDPEPEMIPYRSDPGLPDTQRPEDFAGDVWPPPNPNVPRPRGPEWSEAGGEQVTGG